MRRVITTVILSLFIITGTGAAFADKHHKSYDHGNYEYRGHDRHPDYGKYDRHHKDMGRYKEYKKAHKYNKHWKGHKRKAYGSYKDYNYTLHKMIAYAARGGKDVRVWRISDDTFIVKYYRRGHYYTQRLYPHSGRYGSRGIVNVSWSPHPSWILIPSVNVSIPVD